MFRKPLFVILALASTLPVLAHHASVPAAVRVGGEAMLPTLDIIDNAVQSADHTTLVAAVKAAGLVETLKSDGPFTVFAPTDDAFENLPTGTVESLLRPENKEALTRVLTYHVVSGRLDFDALRRQIRAGETKIAAVSGGWLTLAMNGERNIVVTDAAGRTASISTYDVIQSNGVIHVIDSVLLPQ